MDQVLGVVHAEVVAAVLRRELGRPVDRLPAGRREVTVGRGLGRPVKLDPGRVLAAGGAPRVWLARGIHPGRVAVAGNVDHHVRGGVVRVAGQVAVVQRRHQQGVLLVGAQKAIPPVGHGLAEPAGAAGAGLQRTAVGLEAEADRADVHFPRQARPADRPAASGPRDAVDPVVHGPAGVVDPRPQLAHPEAGEERLAHLRHPVAVAVGQEDNVRGAQHDHAVPRRYDAVAGRQAVGPNRRPVHAPVAVGVLQELHGAVLLLLRLLNGLGVGGDAAHGLVEHAGLVQLQDVEVALQVVAVDLADEDPPPGVEGHGRRVGHQRLGGHQLDAEPGRQGKPFKALLRLQRPRGVGGQLDLAAAADLPASSRQARGRHQADQGGTQHPLHVVSPAGARNPGERGP